MFFLLTMFFIERIFSAYRLQVLLRLKNPGISLWTLLRITFTSNFLGQFMPGAVGVEAIRVAGMAKSTSDLALSFSSMVVDRVLGMMALVLLVLLALAVAPQTIDPLIGYLAWIGLGGLFLGSVAVLNTRVRSAFDKLLWSKLLTPVKEGLHKLYGCLDIFKRKPRTIAWAAVLALSFQFIRVGIAPVGAMALRLDTPLVYFFIFVPIITFVQMLPISIGGLGVREASFMYFFSSRGMTSEEAFTLSILIYLFTLISTLPGAWFCVMGISRKES